jgi:hypothetical protein
LTAPYTPEENGMSERKYATLYGIIRTMLDSAKLPTSLRQILWSLRQLLWAQCASHTTHLENIVCKQNSSTASELFYGKNPPWIKRLNILGETGIGHDHKKIPGKLADHSTPCVFIGYSSNHAPNFYMFLTTSKHSMIQSRNTVWLNLSYGKNIEKHVSKNNKELIQNWMILIFNALMRITL